ncbi:type II toxin-antitoxin system RelE/ParE family toxin [Sphingomonas xanthus]|uniref:Type II toxin-antitoxin system RelE/ParE family toxin n=1 Tax=Sphingomonas xanthus TaxID=2594473 RepID=A0A516IP68_9SPHN|nr:type II toxin-antitoxin system RelE/ParE family toxin [Sphingomonas xanthus]QDP18646.1 type II toxin-antitoxin system RelE/ParE family toxin [Sphingomonas xanthus]
MARYDVALTAGAERDLDSICTYLEQQRGPDAIDEWLDNFNDAIGLLETFPDRGSVPPELEALGIKDIRQKQFKPYRIIYRVMETSVFIMVVAHGSRDFQSLLLERLLRS